MAENETTENGAITPNHKTEQDTLQLGVTDEQLQLHAKLNRRAFDFLLGLLESGIIKRIKNDEPVSDVQLFTALRFLTTAHQSDNVDISVRNVVDSLVEIAPQFIKFPTEFGDIQKKFYALGSQNTRGVGFPNVIGIVECAHVRLRAPNENPDLYVNPHSQHSINVQFVCDPDLQICNVFAAFPGSKEDVCVWQDSNLRHILARSNLSNCWLIGNGEYPQEPWLMTPVAEPKSPAEELYNAAHALTWKPVEQCIALLKSRFECLQTELNYSPKRVCAIVIACSVLHNIYLQHDLKTDINLKDGSNRNTNKTPNEISIDAATEEGVKARATLIENSFTR